MDDMNGQSGQKKFSELLRLALSALAQAGALGTSGRPQASFSAKCSISTKTLRRWLDGERPQADKWENAKAVLLQLGHPPAKVEEMDQSWALSTSCNPSEISAFHYDDIAEHSVEVRPVTPFPKLCSILAEVPEQGSSPKDFILVGEIRFSRAPDIVDDRRITLGVRRAVVLPVPTNCYVKPGSLHRQSSNAPSLGAAQTIYYAGDEPGSILQGDQLQGETLVRLAALDDDTVSELPSVDLHIQLEHVGDLCVELVDLPKGRSLAQRKLAEHWLKHQLANIILEQDGSWRLASCHIRWKLK
ncbi:hypothetical protein [Ciceribacter sp. L1K22]|uniref:hypothetical protein n=1 Tax=Ciceribacter sp. L1K22 TaxID=2820275 RepID=UPI001ABEB8A7|nr:hypothetical protein [Ciceribacter sp. L1K22]MBO3760362.1 hypothetical protein [Ciceribacter sp. L1K22]